MMTLDQIKQALEDRRLNIVSEATGLHYNTLKNIRDGKNENPSIKTLNKISAYLEQRA
jgi:DNA-binding Xre family transcriptional regulator